MAGEVVHHHEVARFQDGRQVLLDPGAEQLAIDAAFHCEWSDEPFRPQCAQKGRRLPPSTRSFLHEARAQLGTTIGASHVGFGPRFIDENDFFGIDQLLRSSPRCPTLDHIGAILLAGNQRLFFRD